MTRIDVVAALEHVGLDVLDAAHGLRLEHDFELVLAFGEFARAGARGHQAQVGREAVAGVHRVQQAGLGHVAGGGRAVLHQHDRPDLVLRHRQADQAADPFDQAAVVGLVEELEQLQFGQRAAFTVDGRP